MYLIFFADAICLNCKEEGPEEGSFPFQDVEKAQGIIMIFYTVQPHFHASFNVVPFLQRHNGLFFNAEPCVLPNAEIRLETRMPFTTRIEVRTMGVA